MTEAVPDFETALATHEGLIRRIAASYEADGARAEDLAQEIALALWRALPRFRAESSLRTFVARIAHNRAVAHVVRAMRNPRLAELDETARGEDAGPEEEAMTSSERRRLLGAVRRLPLGHRQVVTLFLEGFSMGEIAETLGLSENNAAVRMNRARVRLRELLGASR